MKKQSPSEKYNGEIFSLNENIYDMFSIEQLEQRLQMSQTTSWCNPNCTCNVDECSLLGTCQCNVDYPAPVES